MYPIIALKQKSFFTKKAFGMAGAAALLIAALLLVGCNNAVGYDAGEMASSRTVLDTPDIYGIWQYSYDYYDNLDVHHFGYEKYVITASSLTYTTDDNLYGSYGNYTANIVDVVDNDSTSGVIIIQYISPPPDGTADYYNAVYFNNLTATTVKLANAINLSDYSSSEEEDEEDAYANFTWANVDNYVDWDIVNPQSRQ
jgi:hypothetical protein